MSAPEIFAVGDDALAVRVAGRAERHGLAAALRGSGHWLDVVPGKEGVTVHFDPLALPADMARRLLAGQLAKGSQAEEKSFGTITLHMRVNPASAPDLDRVAAENAVSAEVFLDRICASPLIIDMMGFTAGFAYVAGVDPGLVSPRLDVPRQRVAAGSVGMISGQLGLYALAGPAGWQIIGAIVEPLFDARRETPFSLEAGMQIKLIIER
ncbi:MAG: 5-oxoprolinase subunit B family protein [Hyphomonas sp.]